MLPCKASPRILSLCSTWSGSLVKSSTGRGSPATTQFAWTARAIRFLPASTAHVRQHHPDHPRPRSRVAAQSAGVVLCPLLAAAPALDLCSHGNWPVLDYPVAAGADPFSIFGGSICAACQELSLLQTPAENEPRSLAAPPRPARGGGILHRSRPAAPAIIRRRCKPALQILRTVVRALPPLPGRSFRLTRLPLAHPSGRGAGLE